MREIVHNNDESDIARGICIILHFMTSVNGVKITEKTPIPHVEKI